jgi:SAM-dependent methyltransferase
MDRSEWLRERRRIAEQRFDTIWAPVYDDQWGAQIDPSHRAGLGRFLDACPPGGAILDAACGTGKYWPLVIERGFDLTGTDQSQQMLLRAQAKFPDVPVLHVGLQELAFADVFDGVMCMDAMENVFPEDWPLVLSRFHHALHAGGWLYLTVEIPGDDLQQAYDAGVRNGLPVVLGEVVSPEGGYHYYPEDGRVRGWLNDARFAIASEETGDSYWHLISRVLPR